jgi:hypothetical protein
MAEHKFKIGETVFFHPKGPSNAPRGAYQVVRRLPLIEPDEPEVRGGFCDGALVCRIAAGPAVTCFSVNRLDNDLFGGKGPVSLTLQTAGKRIASKGLFIDKYASQ